MAENQTFDFNDMTLGQAEFLEDYSNKTITEILNDQAAGTLSAKTIIAMLAILTNPNEPTAALPPVRKQRIADVEIRSVTS